MNAKELIHWTSLEESRRRTHSGGWQTWNPIFISLGLGAIFAAEFSRRIWTAESPLDSARALISSSQLWLAALIGSAVLGVFSAPFRLYWRRDSQLLAGLPLPGKSLFALGIWRSSQFAALSSLALVFAALPLGIGGSWEFAGRHLLLVCIGFAGSAFLGPAAALSAGAIIASDKAQAMISSVGGEFEAPRTSWLGALPGFAATLVALALIASSSWLYGGRPPGGSILLIAALGIGLPLAAVAMAWSKAADVIPAAVREVAALDREILAHVERSTPSLLERQSAKLLLSSRGQLIAYKDASLGRRRYPSPYFLIPLGIASLWLIAGIQPQSHLSWGGAIVGALLVYSLIMLRRSLVAPIENLRLLRSLGFSWAEVHKAKWSGMLLRCSLIILAGALPWALRSSDKVGSLIFVVVASGLTLFMGKVLISKEPEGES